MKDFTGSTKTKAGWPVKGLFVDGGFIRGYLKARTFYLPYTWYRKSGRCLYPSETNYHLEPSEAPFN